MLFSKHPRTIYANAPAHEVICQFRFPTILAINDTEPAAFQDAIREDFPQFIRREDTAPPQVAGLGGPNPQIKQQKPVTNYHFVAADNLWKINLTQNFIALSTLRYTGWEDFARELDKPLAEFIRIYKPAYFERVGLRYVNIISREKLSLRDSAWTELIAPAYLGAMKSKKWRKQDVILHFRRNDRESETARRELCHRLPKAKTARTKANAFVRAAKSGLYVGLMIHVKHAPGGNSQGRNDGQGHVLPQ